MTLAEDKLFVFEPPAQFLESPQLEGFEDCLDQLGQQAVRLCRARQVEARHNVDRCKQQPCHFPEVLLMPTDVLDGPEMISKHPSVAERLGERLLVAWRQLAIKLLDVECQHGRHLHLLHCPLLVIGAIEVGGPPARMHDDTAGVYSPHCQLLAIGEQAEEMPEGVARAHQARAVEAVGDGNHVLLLW